MEKDFNGMNPYEDILHLPHHVSVDHEQMPIKERAAQFAPFAALTGLDGAMMETARLTDRKIELDETEKAKLDERLGIIQRQRDASQEVEFVYFRPDELKAGGAYLRVRGVVNKIDAYERVVVMQDGTRIPVDEISEIESGMFQAADAEEVF